MAGGKGGGGDGGMSQAENDLWSDIHNPNNDNYLGEDDIGGDKS